MKTFNRLILSLLLLGLHAAHAQVPDATLSLSPSSTTVASTSGTLTFDLSISGLGNLSSKSLGDYDFDLSFDTSKLSFVSGSFGSTFVSDSFFDVMDDTTVSGILNLAQLSLETDPSVINAAQPGSFSLASLTFSFFDLLPGQSTAINFGTIYSLGDENGDPLTVSTSGAVIINPSNTVPVPEPMTLALMGLGALGIRMTRRQKQ